MVLGEGPGGVRTTQLDSPRSTRIEAQGVTAARPHDQCGGEDPENEDHPHDDRRHDVVKHLAEPEPEPVERMQDAG